MSDSFVVIGGGVVGLSTAYYLARGGAPVTVLESGRIGDGCSSVNAGWICPSLSTPLPGPAMPMTGLRSLIDPAGAFRFPPAQIVRLAPWMLRFWRQCNKGAQLAGLRANARLAAGTMDRFDEWRDDGVEFKMQETPLLFAALTARSAQGYLDDLEPMRDFGYDVPAELTGGPALRTLEPSLSDAVAAGFVVRGERIVDPATLLAGLRQRLGELGVDIFEREAVTHIGVGSTGVLATTPTRTIQARGIVVAAGAWSAGLLKPLGFHLPLESGKGYSFTVAPPQLPRHSLYLTEAKVATTVLDGRLRLAGTMELAGLNTSVNTHRVEAMASKAHQYVRGWDPSSVSEGSAGLRPVLPDGLPAIGTTTAPGIFVATGHSMLGVTLAPATGQALADLILGRSPSAALAPFDPGRFRTTRSGRPFR